MLCGTYWFILSLFERDKEDMGCFAMIEIVAEFMLGLTWMVYRIWVN